ncbi:MAG: right-handed parallel beta-helix repeat-containing protein [Fuerstiella sp.]|nr:right-handed parallel beta-helix repeat-containing protein [Fuerstiella sp.]
MTATRLTGMILMCQTMLSSMAISIEEANQVSGSQSILISGDEELQQLSQQEGSGVTGGPGTSVDDAYVIRDKSFTVQDNEDPVTIKNTRRHIKIVRVRITGSRDRAAQLGGLVIENCHNVHVQDSEVTGTKGVFINKSKQFDMAGCHLESNMRVYVYYSSHGKFVRNTITRNQEKGLILANSSHVLIEDNEVHDNAAEGIVAWGHGGLKEPLPPSPTHHITIRNNRVSGNNWHGVGTEFGQDAEISGNIVRGNGGYGINVGSWSHRNHIFGNVVEDTAGQGIIVETSQDSVLENNQIRRSGDNGIWLINSAGTVIRNNEISHAFTGIKIEYSTTGRHALKVRQKPDGTRNRFENNKVEQCFTGAQISSLKNIFKGNTFSRNRDAVAIGGTMNVFEENTILKSVNGLLNSGNSNRIEKNIFDGASNAIVINKGSGNHIVSNRIRDVCFDNIEVRTNARQNTIAGNDLYSTAPGIVLKGKHNIIEKNTIVSTGWFYSTPGAIVINGGVNNTIRQNTFTKSMIGITCLKGSGNDITDNIFTENETAIWLKPDVTEDNLIRDNVYTQNDNNLIDTQSPPAFRTW